MVGSRGRGTGDEVSHVNIVLPPSRLTEVDRDLVERIVLALYRHPETQAAIETAGGGTNTGEPRYVSLSQLKGMPPPSGVPFFNDAIGVLTVPAPLRGGVQAVRAAIEGVAPPGTQVEATVAERIQRSY